MRPSDHHSCGIRRAVLASLMLVLLAAVPAAAAGHRHPRPQTTITRGPGNGSAGASSSATFSFRSSRRRSRFRCALDGRRFRACRSPARYRNLVPGRHRFAVRAIAGRRADRSPARVTWTVASAPVAPAPTAAAPAPAPTHALTVSGNQIMRDGQPFHFRGVDRASLEWGANNWGGCGGDGHFTADDFDRIAAWHVNAVRIAVSQADWLGRRCDAAAYAAMVDDAIAKANARGMEAILDLHWTDVGGRAPCDSTCGSGEQPMPDDDSVVFWEQVARRYANRTMVSFGLFNEPHDVSWSCWRDGGCSVQSDTSDPLTGQKVSYTAVGMQRLVDVVRAQGAANLVLVAGLDWAYDLAGVTQGYALVGSNITYDTHVYTAWHSTPQDWNAHFGDLSATHPVTVTEFGSTDCSSDRTAALLDYLKAPGGRAADQIGWTAWSWNSPGECSHPSVLADWSGTPLGGQGQLIHDALASSP
jgi:endoglucanase